MKYTVTLSDFRSHVWRHYINPDEKMEWKEGAGWRKNFISGKDERFLYKKDFDTIKNFLLSKLKENKIGLTTQLKDKVDEVTCRVSYHNDPEIFATGYLKVAKLELELLRDHTYGSEDEKGKNFNIKFNMYTEDDESVLGIYYRDIFGARDGYDDDKMLAGLRKSIEENDREIKNWGDYHIDMRNGEIKYFGSSKDPIWHLKDKQDVSDFWAFVRKNLPTLKEKKRAENLDNIIDDISS